MKASASNRAQRRNTIHKRPLRRRLRCRDCPFRAPSGKCLDRTIKSGRCGDWVWYLREGKPWRHLYVKQSTANKGDCGIHTGYTPG